jgi:hypothetical protein
VSEQPGHDLAAPGCWCHAAYGQYRAATTALGLCLMCAVLPHMCEAGHRMVNAHPEWSAMERERTGRVQNGGAPDA